MWFFQSDEGETPLTKAVIEDDYHVLKALGGMKDHVLARNFLGFNALDLARYLNKEEALKFLGFADNPTFKVMGPQEKKVELLSKEEFQNLFQVKYNRHLRFSDYPYFKSVVKRMSWINPESVLGKEFCGLYDKYQKQITTGCFADVEIRWIDDVLQYGVFAGKDISKGEYIGEYVGIVQKKSIGTFYDNDYCLRYPLEATFNFNCFLIDGRLEGNESRFLNHSFNPNLDIRAASENGLMHAFFLAKEDIPAGTQLTFNYGEDYWRRRMSPADL